MSDKNDQDKLKLAEDYLRFLCDKYERGWLKYINWDNLIADIKKHFFAEEEKDHE